ncbi:hypothetical protein CRYUN_Cryun20dG0097700 [Craigia yunnanensis]
MVKEKPSFVFSVLSLAASQPTALNPPPKSNDPSSVAVHKKVKTQNHLLSAFVLFSCSLFFFLSLAAVPCDSSSLSSFFSSRTSELIIIANAMKHVLKIFSLLVVISALWIGLLHASIIPRSHTWLLPIYFIVSLGCYGLLMVGVGLMRFPTCPQEALLLQQDIAEAKDFLKQRGVDVGSE